MTPTDPNDGTISATTRRPFDATTTTRTYTLTVVLGPDQGATLSLDGSRPSRILVGQSPSCDLRLSDRRVSRRHLALSVADNGVRLTDLQSTNGTSVDGVHVFEALLRSGNVVQLGESALRIEAAGTVDVALSTEDHFGRLLGASVEMRRLYPLCEALASSVVPVVIEGETGTGKEVLAEALHEHGRRSAGPFIVFDCTAVSPSLIESELFGHERGAFTGAVTTRRGLFEQADGGTLFIDEIGDLELSLQPKLLRALERSEIRRVGGDRWINVDVRVISATRRDLDREVQDGRFRDDLFYRLAVGRIELPTLRARKGDIAFLATHFFRRFGGRGNPPYELLRRLERMPWHGNIRELANAIARIVALGESANELIALKRASRGGDELEDVLALDLPFPRARDRILAEFERRYVGRILALHGGNVTRAAEASGIGRRYFTTLASRSK